MSRALALLLVPLLACADTSEKAEDETDQTGDPADTSDGEDETDTEDDNSDGTGDDGGDGADDGDDGSDDGGEGDDGDGGEGGGDDVPMSEDNAYSAAGCALMHTEAVPLAMGSSRAEANTAVILPDDETAWMLQMPPSGDGWFTIEVPDWMTVVHFFTEEGVELEIMGGEAFTAVLRNGACPDAGISDQRWAFHDWGAYTVRVAEGAPEEVWFTLVKED